MLSSPLLKGRISKWSLALVQFDLVYVSQKSIKGQALANFLAEHPSPKKAELPIEIVYFGLVLWKLYFDSSSTKYGQGMGIDIVSPRGTPTRV